MTLSGLKKQEEMRRFYNTSKYYENAQHNFADKQTRYNSYLIKNVFKVYCPKKNEKILDVGCGWGNISFALQKRGFNVIGLDYSKKSINICKMTAKKMGLDAGRFICRDGTNTGLPANSFDVVYCVDLVEHLYPEVYMRLVKEVHRVLKRGGRFIIYTPNPSHIFEKLKKHNILLKRDVSHVDYKTMKRLKESLAKNGFSIEKAIYMESHIPFFNIVERLFMQAIPLLRRRNAVLAVKK